MFVYDRSYLLIQEFESWITGVFSPHVVFVCDFFLLGGRGRACNCYIVFVCHQNDVCEHSIGSMYVGGYCSLSESGSVSSVNCIKSAFL